MTRKSCYLCAVFLSLTQLSGREQEVPEVDQTIARADQVGLFAHQQQISESPSPVALFKPGAGA